MNEAARPAVCAPLDASGIRASLGPLASMLQEVVADGAGIGFLRPLDRAGALDHWSRVAREVEAGTRLLVVLVTADGVLGSVELALPHDATGAHRAHVEKLMVRPGARRRGLGSTLLAAIEAHARAAGRTLLCLQTFAGSDAERLYRASGWLRAGEVPGYALRADGSLGDHAFYHKRLP